MESITMKFLIIGCGSIGSRHLQNLISLGISESDIVLCDKDESRLNEIGGKFDIENLCVGVDEIKSKYSEDYFDGILITLPTSLHLSTYKEIKDYGKYFFIEKPISHNLENLELLSQNKHRIMIGYNLRFEKGVRAVKQLLDENRIGKLYCGVIEYGSFLPHWHPNSNYAEEHSAKREQGGGIVLDDIHEIDLALHLFGEPIKMNGICVKISDLDIDTEDVADIILEFDNGAVCSIHMDYLQQSPVRKGKIIGEKGVIEWDINNTTVKVFDSEKQDWEILKYDVQLNNMYVDEMRDFIERIKIEQDIELNAEVGVQSLKIAYKILKDNNMV